MKKSNKKTIAKKISAKKFDEMFNNNDDISDFLDFDKAVAINRVNLDLPKWLLDVLDKEAIWLNISRQAVIKTWLADRAYKIKESKKAA